MTDGRRRAIFAVLVAACAIAVAISMARAGGGDDGAPGADGARAAAPVRSRGSRAPVLVFRSMDLRRRAAFGRVMTASAGASVTGRVSGPVNCDRVGFSGGRGICLRQRGTLGKATSVTVLDERWRVLRSLNVDGIPSRTRVSPGGRLGALTTFVAGHAYGSPGSFSTSTVLLDLARGRTIGDLESFPVELDGHKVAPPDRNFWGATFAADEDTFYATFATGHHHYLVRGSVRARRMKVLRDNVECPSLSPDGTRIGYKKTVDGAWRFSVLELATMRDTMLSELQPVDDQLAWLDDQHLLYGKGMDIDIVPADGTGAPRKYIANAGSPTVAGAAPAAR